jgi:hypothetical protein
MKYEGLKEEPSRKVLRAMESRTNSLDNENLKKDLRARGLNPERTLARVKKTVGAFLSKRSPS